MDNSVEPRAKKIAVVARDGTKLAASVYEPIESCRRVVVIAGAVAVKRSFYDRFACFLAGKGFGVVTFDYRGVGDSLTGDIRQARGGLREWGEADLASVVDYARDRWSDAKLLAVGHSVGGQLVGLIDNNRHIARLLAISAQSGNWRLWPAPHRYALFVFWTFVLPPATRILGYFPAKTLGIGENLSQDSALEWARWCRNRDYFVDADGRPIRGHFDDFEGEIRACAIDGDWMAPQKAVEDLMRRYSRANIQQTVLRRDGGTLGHFGFFREMGRPFWEESAKWLAQDEADKGD